jgi:hypothetical protein
VVLKIFFFYCLHSVFFNLWVNLTADFAGGECSLKAKPHKESKFPSPLPLSHGLCANSTDLSANFDKHVEHRYWLAGSVLST